MTEEQKIKLKLFKALSLPDKCKSILSKMITNDDPYFWEFLFRISSTNILTCPDKVIHKELWNRYFDNKYRGLIK